AIRTAHRLARLDPRTREISEGHVARIRRVAANRAHDVCRNLATVERAAAVCRELAQRLRQCRIREASAGGERLSLRIHEHRPRSRLTEVGLAAEQRGK